MQDATENSSGAVCKNGPIVESSQPIGDSTSSFKVSGREGCHEGRGNFLDDSPSLVYVSS